MLSSVRTAAAVLLCVALAAHAAFASYSHLTHPQLGRPAPHPENPNRYVNDVIFRHPHGHRYFKLHYDVEHDEKVVSLHDMHGLTTVTCSDDSLTLTVEPATFDAADKIGVGAFVVGDHTFGCRHSAASGHPVTDRDVPIMREVVSIEHPTADVFVLTTKDAEMTSVFKNAKISMATNHWAQDQVVTEHTPSTERSAWEQDSTLAAAARRVQAEEVEAQNARRAPKGWFHHLIHSVSHVIHNVVHTVVHTVTNVVHTVVNVAKTVVNTIKALVTGDLQFHKDLLSNHMGWNYAPSGGSAAKVYHLFSSEHLQLDCSDCYLGMDLSAYFECDIHHYSLNTIDLTASGALHGRVGLTANAEFSWTWNKNIHLVTINFPSINFMAGPVPIHITFTMPIDLDLSMGIHAQATGSAFVDIEGAVHAGIAYGHQPSAWAAWEGAKGGYGFHTMFVHSLTQNAGASLGASATVTAEAQLLPQFQVSVDGIAHGTVSANPALELDINANAQATLTEHTLSYTGTVTASVYFNMDVAFTASFTLPIIHKGWSYGPKSLYQMHKLIWTHTWSMHGQREFLALPEGASSDVAALDYTECSADCNGHGTCSAGVCMCYPGYTGELCDSAVAKQQSCGSSCTVASGLTVCAQLNGHRVCVDDAADLAARDAQVGEAVLKMATGGPACVNELAAMMCAQTIPLCEQDSDDLVMLCPKQCTDAYDVCGVASDYARMLCTSAALSRDTNVAYSDASCATHPAATDSTALGECVVASGLQYCSAVNGEAVHLNSRLFASVADADAYVHSVAEGLVTDLDDSSCQSAIYDMLCTEYLPACGADGQPVRMCGDACAATMQRCPILEQYSWLCSDVSQIGVTATVAEPMQSECGYARLATVSDAPSSMTTQTVALAAGLAVAGVAVLASVIAATVVVVRRRRAAAKSAALDPVARARLVDNVVA